MAASSSIWEEDGRQREVTTQEQGDTGTAEEQGTVDTGSTEVVELNGETTESTACNWIGFTGDPWRVHCQQKEVIPKQELRSVRATFIRKRVSANEMRSRAHRERISFSVSNTSLVMDEI